MFIDSAVSDFDSLVLHFASMPLVDYTFIRPLNGITLSSDIIEKGRYTFINLKYFQEYIILNNYNYKLDYIDIFLKDLDDQQCCFVETKCQAIDYDKAVDISDILCKRLDNFIRYMFGHRDSNTTFGVFNFNSDITGGHICFIPEQLYKVAFGRRHGGTFRCINLEKDNWFFSKDNGNDHIWSLQNKQPLNVIDQRILRAVDWIGMSLNEKEINIAFIQAAFAIECILQDQDDFITKSITAQICEYAAFIVGYSKDTRIEIQELTKKLYRMRSKIAHGQRDDNIEPELLNVIWLAKQIIISFCVKPELRSIQTVDSLRTFITKQRYSY